MPPAPEGKDFRQDVFPAELEEIRRRRREAGDDRVLPKGAETGPSTDLNLIGLAFSGGGIRSASFCLGVVQCLIRKGLFKYVDYLSTVSGGGYTGSCLSALMARGHGGEQMLVHRAGAEEPAALNHLRNNSNFLVPGGRYNSVRMPSLFLVGVLQTLLLFLPIVMLLVFLTEVFFGLTGWLSVSMPRFTLALIGVTPLVATVFLRPIFHSRYRNWEQRDRADRRAGACLVFAVASLLVMPVLAGLEFLVENDVSAVRENTRDWLQGHLQLGIQSWFVWLVALASVALIVGMYRSRKSILLWVCGALGPLLLLSCYMGCCVYVINSPHVNPTRGAEYRAALKVYAVSGNADDLEQAVNAILRRKQYQPEYYQIDFDTVNNENVGATELKINRRPDAKDAWWRSFPVLPLLTTRQKDQLTIEPAPVREEEVWVPELSVLLLHTDWFVYIAAFLIWLFNYLIVNVNHTSLHPFYRDRLSRTFLIHQGDDGCESADALRLSELGSEQSTAPYHLVNTALNLQGSQDPQLRQRKTVPFMLSKRFCGSDYTGYCETEQMEQIDRNMNLGTAMAISAAAAGPMMGAKTVRSLSFFLAMLNVRLAYWLPHPGRVESASWLDWFIHRNPGPDILTYSVGILSCSSPDRAGFDEEAECVTRFG